MRHWLGDVIAILNQIISAILDLFPFIQPQPQLEEEFLREGYGCPSCSVNKINQHDLKDFCPFASYFSFFAKQF